MKLAQTAFEVDGVGVPFGAVVASGMVSGLIAPAFAELRDMMAADAFLDATQRGLGGAEITPRLNAWRTKRGLTSAELTKGWLQRHELELPQLVAHISRTMAHERIGAELDRARAETPAPFDAAAASFLDHLLFTDRLADLVQDVAMRAAVSPPEDEALYFNEQRALEASLAEVGGAAGIAQLLGLSEAQSREVLAVEVRFRIADREVCSPQALNSELARVKRSLARVEYAEASFRSVGMAREALATLREDKRMWLEQLAHRLGVEPTRRERYVEELSSSAMATRLATAAVGEAVGPEVADGAFLVFEVLSRRDASFDDPEVVRRVQRALRRRAFSSAIERRVRFHYV